MVYDYIHTLGDVGDEVRTEIWPYLSKKSDLTPAEAHVPVAMRCRS